jgi:recombination protein RecA
MSQALRKLSGAIKQSNTALIFTNQLREKIGVMFGSPVTTSGGRALKFYASVRLDIRRIAAIKDKGEVIGNRTRVRVTKNKVAPPFRVAEFDIMYDEGISRAGDLLDMAVELGVVEKRGSYYYYEEESLAQGRENAKRFLREHPDVADQIETVVREELNPSVAVPEIEEIEEIEEASESD